MAINKDQEAAVLAALANGASLRKACRDNGIKEPTTWLTRCNADDALATQYARARDIGYKLLADELLEIADDATGDYIETDTGLRQNPESAARARLRLDTRKWMLAKMLPKVYGDRLDLAHSGSITTGAAALTDAELLQIAGKRKPDDDASASS